MESLLARYFERVLGVKIFAGPRVDGPQANSATQAAVSSRGLCLLVEVGSASVEQPSIQKMGARMLEALRNEWLKKSTDALPEMQWCQASNEDWVQAVSDAGVDLKLAIVCGAVGGTGGAFASSSNVLHVPSFLEMNFSPSLKREAWQAIQLSIQTAIQSELQSTVPEQH